MSLGFLIEILQFSKVYLFVRIPVEDLLSIKGVNLLIIRVEETLIKRLGFWERYDLRVLANFDIFARFLRKFSKEKKLINYLLIYSLLLDYETHVLKA